MVNPVQFVTEVTRELRKVTWPSRQQTIQMTWLVIGVSLVASLYIGGLDLIFQRVMTFLFQQ